MKSILLTGLPGSGKTTLGRQLAARLGRPFVDLDQAIEQRAGCSVGEIFRQQGEEAFRELEAETLARLDDDAGLVLATGGGTILREQNLTRLRRMGVVVFLDRPPEVICQDLETGHRPLLKDGPAALMELAARRRPAYLAAADYRLENAGGPKAALAELEVLATGLALPAYAVIGDPIGHSLSPALHHAAFAAQGLNADATPYAAVRVPKGQLPAFLAGARHSGVRGFNVTLPHKQAILPLLDEVAPGAAHCGAVNTVLCQNGRLCGHNTDMQGLALALERGGRPFAGARVLVLGAGGAARAAALQAGLAGAARVELLARDAARAQALAARVASATGIPTGFGPFSRAGLEAAAARCDLLINATPLGMAGHGGRFESLAFLARLPKRALVCDLIYAPPETPLLAQARRLGLAAQNGLGMLIYQALLAQELFLGKALDKAALYPLLEAELTQKEREQ